MVFLYFHDDLHCRLGSQQKSQAFLTIILGSTSSQTISTGLRLSDCGGQVMWHWHSISLLLGQIVPCTSWKCVWGHCPDDPSQHKPDGTACRCCGNHASSVRLHLRKNTQWVEPKISNWPWSELSRDFHRSNFCFSCFLGQINLLSLLLGSGFGAAI